MGRTRATKDEDKPVPTTATRVQCENYELSVVNGRTDGFQLHLKVKDANGKRYEIRLDDENDRPGLIMHMFETLTVWPAFAFFIIINEKDEIVGFSKA